MESAEWRRCMNKNETELLGFRPGLKLCLRSGDSGFGKNK